MSSRHDISEHEVGKIIVEDNEKADENAIREFNDKFKYNKNYGWDWLHLLRIDQEEKTTLIATDDHLR